MGDSAFPGHRHLVTTGLAGALTLAAIGGAAGCRAGHDARSDARARVHAADIRLDRETERLVAEVPRNGTLQGILATHNIRPEHGAALLDAVTRVFDLRGLKAHHAYEMELTLDGFLREFRYQIDADRFLHVLGTRRAPVSAGAAAADLLLTPALLASSPGTGLPLAAPGAPRSSASSARAAAVAAVESGDDVAVPGVEGAAGTAPDFKVEIVPYRKERALVAVRGRIDRDHPSLVSAINAAGENITLAIELAEIFAGDIDFAHDLQPGDEFELVFEQMLREGARAGYGDILAASFTNSGKTYQAFRYAVPGAKAAYYDEQGRSLHRFFLASPLKFEPRITSGFSYRRLHPILGIGRPHTGVDFGAPAGAPVVAVADATVVSARFTRGGGNTVTLRHAGGYESEYLHLSAFAKGLHAGMHVSQGEVIGKVGATGLATGPHLHYGLKKDGEHVNPITEHKRHPPGEPIPPALLAAFDSARDLVRARFVSASAGRLSPATVTAAAAPPVAPPDTKSAPAPAAVAADSQ